MKHSIDTVSPQVMPEPNSGCWLWVGAIDAKDGYGKITRHAIRAHRVSWEQHFGPIPAGQLVLHRCDVVCCVNPDHLFLGSNFDNVTDRNAKGRTARGWGAGISRHRRLSDEEVRAIRQDQRSERLMGIAYGISGKYAGKIRRRTACAYVE